MILPYRDYETQGKKSQGKKFKNRVMKNSTTISISVISFLIMISLISFGQSNGDYRTKSDGEWGNKQSWQVYSNGNWQNSNSSPQNLQDNSITVRNGHEVVYNKSEVKIGHLIIEQGGALYFENDKGSNGVIKLYGDLQCDGNMGTNGENNNEGFILRLEGSSTEISGEGNCRILEIYKASNDDETDLIINMDMEVMATDDDEAAIYNQVNNSFLNIIVKPGAILQVHSFIDLRVGNENSNKRSTLLLQSDNTGFGSLMGDVEDSDEFNTTVERYLEQNRWHYTCPPVEQTTASVFNNIYLMSFSEVNASWSYITDPATLLQSEMEGYASWASSGLTGSVTLEFNGKINTGEKSINLTNSFNPASINNGFNFVGNPYSCAVDWDANEDNDDVWTKTHIDNAIYFWNPDMGTYGSYVNGIGVNSATNIISAHQGFFVHCNQTSGVLGVKPEAQVHEKDAFLKSSNTIDDIVRLSVNGNGYKDETAIRAWDVASKLFDTGMDALKMFGADDAPHIYSIMDDENMLSINSLPIEENGEVVKLGFKSAVDGTYTLSFDEISGVLANRSIFLEDLLTGEKTELIAGSGYSFAHNASNASHRFNLVFYKTSGTDVTPFNQNELKANVYSYKNMVHIEVAEYSTYTVSICNMMGQEIINDKVSNGIRAYQIDKAGYYIASVVSEAGIKKTKVYIN